MLWRDHRWKVSVVNTRCGHSILVLDDNEDAVTSLAECLRMKGYEVTTSLTVRDALDALDEHAGIHTVISDVRMPEVDGFDFWRVVKYRYPAIRVILITGQSISDDDVVPRGATILTKPVQFDTLLSLLPPALSDRLP